jgi:hypothetical protein
MNMHPHHLRSLYTVGQGLHQGLHQGHYRGLHEEANSTFILPYKTDVDIDLPLIARMDLWDQVRKGYLSTPGSFDAI